MGARAARALHPLRTAPVSSRPPGDIGLCTPKPLRQFKALRGTLGHAVFQPNVYRFVGHQAFWVLAEVVLAHSCLTDVSFSLGV